MEHDNPIVPSEDKNDAGLKRTRRNVMAMAGIAAGAIVAASVAPGKAKADLGRPSFPSFPSRGGPACFLAGTKILTERGEISIEDLQAGDKLPTLSGQLREVKEIRSWVAERDADKNWSDDIAPIKVCRSALGPNLPRRDLYLSPLHCLFVDGVLIAARNLVNGRSIVRCSDYDATSLAYFHVELEDHQVIWAEGVPVESRFAEAMVLFAPLWDGGRRFQLASRLRSAVSPWFDRRNAFDRARDRLEARSEFELAA